MFLLRSWACSLPKFLTIVVLIACLVSLRSSDSAPGADQPTAYFNGAAKTQLRGVERYQTEPK